MADLIKSKSKPKENNSFFSNHVVNIKKKNSDNVKFTIFDLAILIFSFLSVLSDLCTDLILVLQYSYQGYKSWAIATFILIFFPSSIVQFFSIRWHVSDKSASVHHWVFHFFMLGIIQRYISIIKSGYKAYKSNNSCIIQKIYFDQSDLCMLHLFESFLESSPQLVLQVYVIARLNEWRFWTVFSALVSLLSLSWALVSYSKTQRQARPNKNCITWIGLFFQAIWSAGMLLARIATLMLGVFCFGNYIFLFITIHWLAMTIWIINQKTDFCESYWEERIYNAVVGVIYCFCFFNLQEGHSRWRLLTFYTIITFENLSCLTIFLFYFGESSPKLAASGFVAIIGGTVIGTLSMLVYYRFYHPSGPIKFTFHLREEISRQKTCDEYCSMTLRSLKKMQCDIFSNVSPKATKESDSGSVLSPTPTIPSNSIIIVEENDDEDVDIKTLQNWISENNDIPKSVEINVSQNSPSAEITDENAFKRRAICSTPHLVKLLEANSKTEEDSNYDTKLTEEAESTSEDLPNHDYENLCSVNIARDVRGVRSWKGYLDIDTVYHDNSTVNNRELENSSATPAVSDGSFIPIIKETESTKHCNIYNTLVEDEAPQRELENSFCDELGQCSIDTLEVTFPLRLDTITEESEDLNVSGEWPCGPSNEKTFSKLVATINEIQLNTPISNRQPQLERFKLLNSIPRKLILN